MAEMVAKCEVILSNNGTLHAFHPEYDGRKPSGRQIAVRGARIRREYIPVYDQAEEVLFAKKANRHVAIDPEDIEITPGVTPTSQIFAIARGVGISEDEVHLAFTKSRGALLDAIGDRRAAARKAREQTRSRKPADEESSDDGEPPAEDEPPADEESSDDGEPPAEDE